MTTWVAGIERTDLEAVNLRFAASEPRQIVAWAAERFGSDLVMSSSFGADAAVLIHLAIQVIPRIRIIFIDTGYLFPETHRYMETLRLRFNLNVWTYRTWNDPFAFLQQAGEREAACRQQVEACCQQNKSEPFERAMRQLRPKAWLRGIRTSQTFARRQAKVVEWSPPYGCYAISPLLNWSAEQVADYIKRNELPCHPLKEQGYASIGCNPLSCTRPIMTGDDARSGRWTGQAKAECGINLLNSMDSAKL